MSKKTSTIEKKTFVGLVIQKLANTGHKDLTSRITAKSDNLDVEYKTAQRYARDYIYVNSGEQDKLRTELEELVKQQAADTITESEAEAPVEVEASTKIMIGEVEYDIEDVEAALAVYENGGCAADVYDCRASEMCHWLVGIDDGIINGTIAEAKLFISTIDNYCDKLRDLIAEKAKIELKEHLQQIRELETVLDKSEIENIWLDVATEGGELITTPFSAETNTKVVDLPNVEELEPSNTVIAL